MRSRPLKDEEVDWFDDRLVGCLCSSIVPKHCQPLFEFLVSQPRQYRVGAVLDLFGVGAPIRGHLAHDHFVVDQLKPPGREHVFDVR